MSTDALKTARREEAVAVLKAMHQASDLKLEQAGNDVNFVLQRDSTEQFFVKEMLRDVFPGKQVQSGTSPDQKAFVTLKGADANDVAFLQEMGLLAGKAPAGHLPAEDLERLARRQEAVALLQAMHDSKEIALETDARNRGIRFKLVGDGSDFSMMKDALREMF